MQQPTQPQQPQQQPSAPAQPPLVNLTPKQGRGLRITQFDLSQFPIVRLFASVSDSRGLPIKNLRPEDFSITENGKPVPQVRFANPDVFNLPLAICFVIDVSGSMEGIPGGGYFWGPSMPQHQRKEGEPRPIDMEVEAVKSFIQQLEPDDQVALVKFSESVVIVQDFTKDKDAVVQDLQSLQPFGQTRLYDSIRQAMNATRQLADYRRAVIVLSDGMDNASTETPDTLATFYRDEVLAKNESFSVFTLGLGDQIDVNGLTMVAEQTGGQFFESPTPYDLKAIYQTILNQILNEYVLEYDSSESRQGAIVEGTVTAPVEGAPVDSKFTFRSPGLSKALARLLWPGIILMAIAFITLIVLTISKLLRAAWVTVMVAPLEGKDFVLHDDNLLGRGEECTVQIRHDPGVWLQHARIQLTNDGFVLTGLAEDNPPLFRNAPISRAMLQDGDDFILGNTRIVFHERRVKRDAGEVEIDYLMAEADREERDRRAALGIIEPPPGKPAGSALVVTGPHSGMAFELKAELTIGRKEGLIVLPEDHEVSRLHLVIRKMGDNVEVEDLGSTNGSELNGHKLAPHQPEPVHAGDLIKLGGTMIKLL
jgi:Ca-activated chloride channel family protein